MIPHSLSVVIPFLNEEGSVKDVIGDVVTALQGLDFEIIAVDDGSGDNTGLILSALSAADARIKVISHSKPVGQSCAIRTGVRAASHEWIATLDGDGQNPPDQLLPMLAALDESDVENIGLVQGQRMVREDTLSKRWASKMANHIRAAVLRDGVRDSGCGLKLFRCSAYLDLPFFDHIHRFMPIMMLREGWKIKVVDVTHRPRKAGQSKYNNLNRALVGIVDLLGVVWLMKRRSRLMSPAEPQRDKNHLLNQIGHTVPQQVDRLSWPQTLTQTRTQLNDGDRFGQRW